MPSLLLATNIVACDADAGYTILPVLVKTPYETGFGKELVTPIFPETTQAELSAVNKLLGSTLTAEDAQKALSMAAILLYQVQKEKKSSP